MASSRPSTGLSRSYLAAFFDESMKDFEQALEAKLQSINQPRFTMASPGRSFVLKVHLAVFTAALAQRFVDAEVQHYPPADNLLYHVLSLSLVQIVLFCCWENHFGWGGPVLQWGQVPWKRKKRIRIHKFKFQWQQYQAVLWKKCMMCPRVIFMSTLGQK